MTSPSTFRSVVVAVAFLLAFVIVVELGVLISQHGGAAQAHEHQDGVSAEHDQDHTTPEPTSDLPHKHTNEAAHLLTHCPDNVALMRAYCADQQYLGACFDLVSEVERFLTLLKREAIFDALKAIEPQSGTVYYWAVDETSESEDSHLDLRTKGIAEYYDNPAYYYAQERHLESIHCQGWSLTFWKRSADEGGARSLQLAYCEENEPGNVRVCGAFDVVREQESN